jgi:dynactin complex subunit
VHFFDLHGVVYAGLADFTGKGKVQHWCGILMDSTAPQFHDGCFEGTRYFECPKERGMFCKPSKVTVLRDVELP